MVAIQNQIRRGLPVVGSPDITLPRPREAADRGRGSAVLFADVSKSMLLHARLGDQAARSVIDMLLDLAASAVRSHGGRVVKTLGDEILAVLPHADAAARAGCDLLMKVDACEPQGDVSLGMHIGFHAGPFIEIDGDVHGDAVNIASRLTDYAKAGQILTTRESVAAISPLVRRLMRPIGALDIRGKRDEMEVEEILWQDEDVENTVIGAATNRTSARANTRLVLTLGDRQWSVGPKARSLSVGRDSSVDIVIESTQASRNHGSFEYRNGGFFYVDKSLNGSFVSFGATGESMVLRNEIFLSGQGVICFGHSIHVQGDILKFHTET